MSTTDLLQLLRQAAARTGYGFGRSTANAIGISERHLTAWIRGDRDFNPNYKTAEALRKHLTSTQP